MSFTERFIVKLASNIINSHTAFRLAKALMATQGVGWAGPTGGVNASGESIFLKNYLSTLITPVVFDVGANIGDFAIAVLKASPTALLHCFEPSHEHHILLSKRLEGRNYTINKFGLSDKRESLTLYKDQLISGLSTLVKRDLDHLNISLALKENVLLEVGDNYLTENGISFIDYLKIDVEGWEMSVIQGFNKAFSTKAIRLCQFEFGHCQLERKESFRDFYKFFNHLEYRMAAIKPNGKILDIPEYNEFFENYYTTNYLAYLP